MAVPMTSLSRAPNGDWFARKGIPKDVREPYKRAFGVSQEERFRRPGSLSTGSAKAELREWDATVTGRIEALRAAARGEGRGLTHREAHGLAGQWYAWFVARYSDEPGGSDTWESHQEALDDARGFGGKDYGDPEAGDDEEAESPAVTRRVHACIAARGEVALFLDAQNVVLSMEATKRFFSALEHEFGPALEVLKRRSGGDFADDERPQHHPEFKHAAPGKAARLTCWTLFEAWIAERQPGASTVNRWRAVFRGLEAYFEGRDIATINGDDAIAWKNTLVTPERTAGVVNDVWLRAARVAFGWARDNKRIPVNPFERVTVAVGKAQPKVREREFLEEEWRVEPHRVSRRPFGLGQAAMAWTSTWA